MRSSARPKGWVGLSGHPRVCRGYRLVSDHAEGSDQARIRVDHPNGQACGGRASVARVLISCNDSSERERRILALPALLRGWLLLALTSGGFGALHLACSDTSGPSMAFSFTANPAFTGPLDTVVFARPSTIILRGAILTEDWECADVTGSGQLIGAELTVHVEVLQPTLKCGDIIGYYKYIGAAENLDPGNYRVVINHMSEAGHEPGVARQILTTEVEVP